MNSKQAQQSKGPFRPVRFSRSARDRYGLEESVSTDIQSSREIAGAINRVRDSVLSPESAIQVSTVHAAQLLHEVYHHLFDLYGRSALEGMPLFQRILENADAALEEKTVTETLRQFHAEFPPSSGPEAAAEEPGVTSTVPRRLSIFQELFVVWLQNENPALKRLSDLFGDEQLRANPAYEKLANAALAVAQELPALGDDDRNLAEFLLEPTRRHPGSLEEQLRFIQERWGSVLGPLRMQLLRGMDLFREENKGMFAGPGPGESRVYHYGGEEEVERFSPDRDWMPNVVLIAKSTLVWLDQLSRAYSREIRTLDAIPDEELDRLARWGFTGLWLIGLWERSRASRTIKRRMGNPEAEASAYSLRAYEIAGELGGWPALDNLKQRCLSRGIRLASDMVPNHTGIDSAWMEQFPDRFVQLREPPFSGYTFNGDNLSSHPDVGIYLEDHYYDRTDAAVVFKRVHFPSGDTRYIYHGNDGTHLPWNDTAQLNFLNPETREAVLETILHVAETFPIIRFDAAMTLAARHYQRLWFPEPGSGGDIPSRAEHGLSKEDFRRAMPEEFWREVVDRVASALPDTLLLAEAFWMMEGYFVRTLGMHRVYNSAFMNMLKSEENEKYRQTIKNTIEFDRNILGRFVNFMNNPDEETAVAQFGRDDKYFGVCTLMATMPGLPMFGHGQVEGFSEKYGMEFRRANRDEEPDVALVGRHEREIFPLFRRRYIFAHVENFLLFDLYRDNGTVNENVFAYSNRFGEDAAIVLYNNSMEPAWGWIRQSAAYGVKEDSGNRTLVQTDLGDALALHSDDRFYCLLFETKSRKWFVRKSSELREQGLQIGLSGYECQVFADIREVEDDEAGSYAAVAALSHGAGIGDLNRALEEAYLKPVYEPLDSLTAPELLRSLVDQLRFGATGEIDRDVAIPPDYLPRYRSFVEAAVQFADVGSEAGVPADRAAALFAAAARVLGGGLPEGEQVVEAIAGWLLLSPLKLIAPGRNLVDEWALARRLAGRMDEVIGAAERPGWHPEAYAALLRAILNHEDWYEKLDNAGPDTGRDASRRALELLFADQETSQMLGVNRFEGVVWFGREAFQSLTHALPLAAAVRFMASGEANQDALETIASISFHWREAESASGYQLEKLFAALS